MHIPLAHQFFIAGLDRTTLSERERSLIVNQLGGVILFKRNIESLEQVVELNSSIINTNPDHPPLISVDQEGGRVARLRGICTDVPPLLELSSAFRKDETLSYRLGAMQARELVALGFQLNFAPVCDVLSNSDNEVIGDRAFSKDSLEVARWAMQYIKGLQGAGVAGCAKHFPGHGRTAIDSHLALPVIDTSLEDLHATELVPFKAAIEADVATIMTAHIITKPLDTVPATLSEKTLSQLLRRQLGFTNVIISDDLDMKAVADHYALKDILEQAVMAGVDMFIIGNNLDKTVDAIAILQNLIDTDEKIRTQLMAAQARITTLRTRYVGKPLAPDLVAAQAMVRSRPHLELVSSCG